MVLIVVFIPYKTISVPEWKIKVLKRDGQPASQIEVSQTWWDYGVLEKKEEIRISDEEGNLTFPERIFWSPLAVRGMFYFFDSVNNIVMMHGSIRGNTALISANKTDSNWLWYKQGSELKEILQLRLK